MGDTFVTETTDFVTEITDLEHRYWQAIKDHDSEAAMALTSDPCIIIGAQGVASVERSAFAAMMKAARWKLHAFMLSNVVVQRFGDDVAVIGYKVRENLTVEGAELSLEAADASTWIRQNGRWVCALHTESILGDPYGRDRHGNGKAT